MTTIGVILNKLMSSKCMSINVISFVEFRELAASYKVASIVLLDDEKYFYLDAYKLFRDFPLSLVIDNEIIPVNTWELFAQYISNIESSILKNYYTKVLVPKYWEINRIKDDNNNIIESEFEETPFVSNTDSQLNIVSVENDLSFDVQACNHNDFYERRSLGRYYYPDVSIIKVKNNNITNLQNSIPIVNGIAFYPEVRHNEETGYDELIAHDAGKILSTSNWNQNNVKTVKHRKIVQNKEIINDYYRGGETQTENAFCYNKNIMLIDFSSFGSISTIKLSDCKNGKIEYVGTVYDPIPSNTLANKKQNIHIAYIKGNIEYPESSYYKISFDLPTGTEIGIPIVCILGRLFYLHEDSEINIVDNTITLSVKINRQLFNDMLLSNLQWSGKRVENINIVEEKAIYTLNELFVDTELGNGTEEDIARLMYEDIITTPFVVMIHSNKIISCTKTEPIMTIGPDKFLFPKNSGGVLINKNTREIIDYVRQNYDSSTLLETAMIRPINHLSNDIKQLTKDSLAFEFNNYKSRSKYRKFDVYDKSRDLSEYILVDFAYMEKPNGSE